jgi:hypothetical protein
MMKTFHISVDQVNIAVDAVNLGFDTLQSQILLSKADSILLVREGGTHPGLRVCRH